MTTSLIDKWQKFAQFAYCVLCTFLIVLVSACGDAQHSYSETETGSIACSVEWVGAPTIERSGNNVVVAAAENIDCEGAGVSNVWLGVYDEADNNPISNAAYDCSEHSGTVYGVPAGSNRRLVVEGQDSYGVCVYRGEVMGITVTGGQTTDVGTVLCDFLGTVVGRVDTPDSACDVHVSGSYAYVADEYGGLQVIDISDPTNPSIPAFVDTFYPALSVYVSGNYAYVAVGDGGLSVVNISNPIAPTISGSVDTSGWAVDVCMYDYAYVADGDLQVIDVSDPAHPTIDHSVVTPGDARGVDYDGVQYAYVADGGSGLQVVDMMPIPPTIISFVDTPGYASDVSLCGDYAYVADGGSGLQVVDVMDPYSPTIVGSVLMTGGEDAGKVYIDCGSGYAYVANCAGLNKIDIFAPANPSIASCFDSWSCSNGVYVSDGYVYRAVGNEGLQVIRLP